MRPYEVMVIFDADLEEEVVRSAVDRATQLLQSRGAELGYVDFWGKRRFAYRLKHRWEGYYVVFQARSEPRPKPPTSARARSDQSRPSSPW